MAEIKITLAILTRNRTDCLRTALMAATAGTSVPDEILVSDDSNDALLEETQAVVASFPGVRYIRGPRKGLGANENHLVSHATGDWIVFIGDDARLSDEFVANLRAWLARNTGNKLLPSGYEIRNGEIIRPHRLNFFGYQCIPHDDYSSGSPLETIVVQATAFPLIEMRTLRWLEVSLYGSDEVDMAYKFRNLGYKIVYEPSLWLHHDQSEIGRNEYPAPTQVARMYVLLRIYAIYQKNLLKFLLFFLAAPWQLIYAFTRRGMLGRCVEVINSTAKAYAAFLASLGHDWRIS